MVAQIPLRAVTLPLLYPTNTPDPEQWPWGPRPKEEGIHFFTHSPSSIFHLIPSLSLRITRPPLILSGADCLKGHLRFAVADLGTGCVSALTVLY